jgi:AcrR family transcriptional regulator
MTHHKGQAVDIRAAILDATEAVILEQGYAAVSNSVVAVRAGVKRTNVQYYFPRKDELLIAAYQRSDARVAADDADALRSGDPVRTLWTLAVDEARAAIGLQFMALAHNRKVLRNEIAGHAERARLAQAEALARASGSEDDRSEDFPPTGVAFLINAIGRSIAMERALGLTCGHAEACLIVGRWLAPPEAQANKPRADNP